MSADEALDVVELLVEMWPNPELTETGLKLLTVAVMDTGLSHVAAMQAVRALMQEDHRFRPQPIDLKRAAAPTVYHRPYLVPALPAAPVAPEVAHGALAEMRARLRGESAS